MPEPQVPQSAPETDTRPALLSAAGLSASYGSRRILLGIDLELRRGEVTALVGPNGCGKTTCLRVLLGLLPAQAGTLSWSQANPRIGYVPQADASEQIFPVSALEVVLMGLTASLGVFRRPQSKARARCREAMQRFGVDSLAGRPFRELSGGQRQRVLLARALVADPDLLALDEPVRGLDFASSTSLVSALGDLARERNMAIVIATHSLELVANDAHKVALFKDGKALVGPVTELFDDQTLSEHMGIPLRVRVVEGVRVILPGAGTANRRPGEPSP